MRSFIILTDGHPLMTSCSIFRSPLKSLVSVTITVLEQLGQETFFRNWEVGRAGDSARTNWMDIFSPQHFKFTFASSVIPDSLRHRDFVLLRK